MQLENEIEEEKERKSIIGRFTLESWHRTQSSHGDKWEAEPDVDRVVDGLAKGMVARNKAIGNGQVPLVAAYAFLALEKLVPPSTPLSKSNAMLSGRQTPH
jgi:hypothetical protein